MQIVLLAVGFTFPALIQEPAWKKECVRLLGAGGAVGLPQATSTSLMEEPTMLALSILRSKCPPDSVASKKSTNFLKSQTPYLAVKHDSVPTFILCPPTYCSKLTADC